MKHLPKSLTQVTVFSKLLALILILAFLGVAFYAGIAFDEVYSHSLAGITPTPTPILSNQNACRNDSDCVLTENNTENACCPNIRCINDADSSTIAVNAQWLLQQKAAVCGVHHLCPMIMVMCTRQLAEENSHYSAKCIQHICQKVRQ